MVEIVRTYMARYYMYRVYRKVRKRLTYINTSYMCMWCVQANKHPKFSLTWLHSKKKHTQLHVSCKTFVDRFRDDCDDHGAFPSTAAGWWGGGWNGQTWGWDIQCCQAIALEIESRLRHNLRMKRRRSKKKMKKKTPRRGFFLLDPGWWLLLGKSSVSCELRWKLMLHTRSNRIHSTTSKRGTRPSNVLTCPAPISTVVPKFLSVHTSPLTQAVFPQTRAQLPAIATCWQEE